MRLHVGNLDRAILVNSVGATDASQKIQSDNGGPCLAVALTGPLFAAPKTTETTGLLVLDLQGAGEVIAEVWEAMNELGFSSVLAALVDEQRAKIRVTRAHERIARELNDLGIIPLIPQQRAVTRPRPEDRRLQPTDDPREETRHETPAPGQPVPPGTLGFSPTGRQA